MLEKENRKTKVKELQRGVSVVIPTYNRPDYLERLLKSIQRQTIHVDEIIIVNDHSKNKCEYENVINSFKDMNIIYIYNRENYGAPMCRNIGIQKASYDLLALTDDDDEWEQTKTEKQVKFFSNNNEIGLLYTWGKAVDESGKCVYSFRGEGEGNDLKSLLISDFIPSSSVMVKTEAIRKVRGFDIRFPSCQDWDMWVRIIADGNKYGVVKEDLLIYHMHSGSSIGKSEKAYIGYRKFYRKHLIKYFKLFCNKDDKSILANAIINCINMKWMNREK